MSEYAIYTIHDLSSWTGVPPRRIRSWIEKGLVPPAYHGAPRSFRYGQEHMRAIREVLEFQDEQVTLRELAERKGLKFITPDWEDDPADGDPADTVELHDLMHAIDEIDL